MKIDKKKYCQKLFYRNIKLCKNDTWKLQKIVVQ